MIVAGSGQTVDYPLRLTMDASITAASSVMLLGALAPGLPGMAAGYLQLTPRLQHRLSPCKYLRLDRPPSWTLDVAFCDGLLQGYTAVRPLPDFLTQCLSKPDQKVDGHDRECRRPHTLHFSVLTNGPTDPHRLIVPGDIRKWACLALCRAYFRGCFLPTATILSSSPSPLVLDHRELRPCLFCSFC